MLTVVRVGPASTPRGLPTTQAAVSPCQRHPRPPVVPVRSTYRSPRFPLAPATHRRHFACLLILIVVAILGAKPLLAAGGEEGGLSTRSPVDLVVVFKSDPGYIKAFEDTADAYSRTFENVSIDLIDIPEARYAERLTSLIESGTQIDVIHIDWNTYPSVNEHLLNLQEYMGEEYLDEDDGLYQGWLNMLSSDGSYDRSGNEPIFQAPLSTGTTVLAYNPTLFMEANVDPPTAGWTWKQFREAAKVIQESTDATWGVANVDSQFLPHAVVASFGGELFGFDNDGQPQFGGTNSKTIDALRFLKALMYNDNPVAPTPDEQHESPIEAFKNGRAAMYFLDTSEFPELYSFPDWDIQALPKGPNPGDIAATPIYGERLALLDSSRNPHHAWAFIDLLNSGTGQAAIDNHLGVADPALQRVAKLSRFRDGRAGAPEHNWIRTDVLKDSAENITVPVYPITPNASEVHNVLNDAIRHLWSDKDATAEDVMEEAATLIDPLLQTP